MPVLQDIENDSVLGTRPHANHDISCIANCGHQNYGTNVWLLIYYNKNFINYYDQSVCEHHTNHVITISGKERGKIRKITNNITGEREEKEEEKRKGKYGKGLFYS